MAAKPGRKVWSIAVPVLLGAVLAAAAFGIGGSRAASPTERVFVPELAADSAEPPPTPVPTSHPTIAPTVVATVTPTPAPTAAPTPAPSPPASNTVTAGHSSYYTDSIGVVHILGDVTNGLDTPISFAQVTAALSNRGTLVASQTTFAQLETIPPGATAPFDVEVVSPPNFDSIDVELTDYDVTGEFDPPIVSGLDVKLGTVRTDSIGYVHVPVTVTNNSGVSWDFVQPILGFYNSEGALVLLDSTYSQPTTLAAGQSGTSEFLFSPDYNPQVSTAHTWVEADAPS